MQMPKSKKSMTQILVESLKDNELPLTEKSGKEELIKEAIKRVAPLDEKCRLALEILAADETNKEAGKLGWWTLFLALATVALVIATCQLVQLESSATHGEAEANNQQLKSLKSDLKKLQEEWKEWKQLNKKESTSGVISRTKPDDSETTGKVPADDGKKHNTAKATKKTARVSKFERLKP